MEAKAATYLLLRKMVGSWRLGIRIFLLYFSLVLSNTAFSQSDSLKNLIKEANTFNELYMLDLSIDRWKQVIELAQKENQRYERINAEISLAEVWRRSGQELLACKLLRTIEEDPEFPDLIVRKYSRLASVYQERSAIFERQDFDPNDIEFFTNLPSDTDLSYDKLKDLFNDSAEYYIQKAVPMAVRHELFGYLANVKSEVLVIKQRRTGGKKGDLPLIREIGRLFLMDKDTHNYVGSLTHLASYYYSLNEIDKAHSIIDEGIAIIGEKPWYGVKSTLLSMRMEEAIANNDSLEIYKWTALFKQADLDLVQNMNQSRLKHYLVYYETERLKSEAKNLQLLTSTKELELEQELRSKRNLTLFLIVLFLLLGITIALFIRQKELTTRYKDLSKKYQMLTRESNHRIKNNLQMIASIISFSRMKPNKPRKDMLEALYRKVFAIQAMNQHLNLDEHNRLLKARPYFQELVKQYRSISTVEDDFCSVDPNLYIASERLVYFGLILNELLTNTVEHCTEEHPTFDFKIEKLKPGVFRFFYSDNSPKPQNVNANLGLELIEQLIDRVEGFDFITGKNSFSYQFNFVV